MGGERGGAASAFFWRGEDKTTVECVLVFGKRAVYVLGQHCHRNTIMDKLLV